MSDELKPCPFCGGDAKLTLSASGRHHTECDADGCHAHLYAYSETKAIAAWNRRPAPPAAKAVEATSAARPMQGLDCFIRKHINADGEESFQVQCLIGYGLFSICKPRADGLEALSLRRTFEDALREVIASEVEAVQAQPASPPMGQARMSLSEEQILHFARHAADRIPASNYEGRVLHVVRMTETAHGISGESSRATNGVRPPAPTVVYEVHNRVFSMLYANEADAQRMVASAGAPAGLTITPRPVHGVRTPDGGQP